MAPEQRCAFGKRQRVGKARHGRVDQIYQFTRARRIFGAGAHEYATRERDEKVLFDLGLLRAIHVGRDAIGNDAPHLLLDVIDVHPGRWQYVGKHKITIALR